MGASASLPHDQPLRTFTAIDVAKFVKDIGEMYEPYAATIESDGIDGAFLASLAADSVDDLLDCLQITNRLHRRKIERMLGNALSWQRDDASSSGLTISTNTSDSSNSNSGPTKRSSTTSRRSRGSHSRAPSDVPVDMVIECALAANEIDNLVPGSSSQHVPAVFEAILAAQALENQNLQHDVLELETERKQLDSAPEGTVAIVLTDVEGSTSLWENHPEAMRTALALHDDIQRQLREKNFGYEIDTEGDAFFLAFSEPCDALAFALDLQVALNKANWSEEILSNQWGCDDGERRGLKVRVSIHMGPVETMKNPVTGRTEYDGEGMAVAQAVEKMTRGGQILCTMDTWSAAFHLADAKLGSPITDEFTKPVIMPEEGVEKRLVEITHASMLPLTDATVKDAWLPRRPKKHQNPQPITSTTLPIKSNETLAKVKESIARPASYSPSRAVNIMDVSSDRDHLLSSEGRHQ